VSKFADACKVIDKDRKPSETIVKNIMGENFIEESILPPPLKWGRKKRSDCPDLLQ